MLIRDELNNGEPSALMKPLSAHSDSVQRAMLSFMNIYVYLYSALIGIHAISGLLRLRTKEWTAI